MDRKNGKKCKYRSLTKWESKVSSRAKKVKRSRSSFSSDEFFSIETSIFSNETFGTLQL